MASASPSRMNKARGITIMGRIEGIPSLGVGAAVVVAAEGRVAEESAEAAAVVKTIATKRRRCVTSERSIRTFPS